MKTTTSPNTPNSNPSTRVSSLPTEVGTTGRITQMRKKVSTGLLLLLVCTAAPCQAQLVSHGNRLLTGLDLPTAPVEQGAGLGWSVTAGDFDGNGTDDLAIGSPFADLGTMSDAGQVVVLYNAGSTGELDDEIFHQNVPGVGEAAENGDHFGDVVSSGDFNGDGYDDLVISATAERLGSATSSGIVHVIYGSSEGLQSSTEQTLTRTIAPGALEGFALFGAALASGDFDSDGYDDLAIGCPGESVNGAVEAGAVIVAYGTSNGLDATSGQLFTQWHLGASNGADDAEAGDLFGAALAVGDFDGDSYDDLAVGAPMEDQDGLLDVGAANVIYGHSNGLANVDNQFLLAISDYRHAGDEFGSVLATGDFNGDGTADLAIGVPGYGSSPEDMGLLYIAFSEVGFGIQPSLVKLRVQNLLGASAEAGDRLGSSLTVADFNHDGYDDLVIGADLEDIGSVVDAGAISVLMGYATAATSHGTDNSRTWSQDSTAIVDGAEAGDRFGFAVVAGKFDGGQVSLAVGVPGESVGGFSFSGAVHLIHSVVVMTGDFESGDLRGWSSATP